MLLTVYSLLCFLIPNTVWIFLNRSKIKDRKYALRHIVWVYIFMYYCYLSVQDAAGIGTLWDLIRFGHIDKTINLIPFSSEGIMTYLLNVIMFMPLGFLLPLIWDNYRRIGKVVLLGFFMSLSIEILQLFSLRATDIDDLIMNTLGTFLGFLSWIIFKRLFKNAGSKALMISHNEPLIYIFLGMSGIFFLYNWDWML